MEVSISTKDISKLQKRIEKISRKVASLDSLLLRLQPIVMEDVEMRFKTSPPVEEGGKVHGGVYWKALSSYTIKLNNRQGGKILINTGELMRSLTMQGNSYNIARVEDNSLIFGTRHSHGEKHQPPEINNLASLDNMENHVKAGEVPMRPYIFFHDELTTKLVQECKEYIAEVKK